MWRMSKGVKEDNDFCYFLWWGNCRRSWFGMEDVEFEFVMLILGCLLDI